MKYNPSEHSGLSFVEFILSKALSCVVIVIFMIVLVPLWIFAKLHDLYDKWKKK